MKQITQNQFEKLEKAGLIDHTKSNKNYYISGKQKKSKQHKYYVSETKKILNFLKVN